uniref:cytochrome c oxidase subunit 7A2, mitochondrial-like n=1 Tax=Callithrix jacchus TaxID=9483 RepID=UPI0023DD09CF|nr:cytochrome c oxidase subunit 7A2, mitochondrial-like [Callithrix jacchus]
MKTVYYSITETLQNLLALCQIGQRTINTASHRHFKNKFPEKQKLFQGDDGIPVYLKSGVADVLLYRATMILSVGRTACAIYQLAMASFPQEAALTSIIPAITWFSFIQLSMAQ